jgi:hypothetical protein
MTQGKKRGNRVALTNEQIEAEIAELIAEADRLISRVKSIFTESAKLRLQAEHLKRLLELRTDAERHTELMSFTLMGYAREGEEEPTAFCAATWSGSISLPSEARIFISRGWQTLLPSEIVPYFSDLLDDWKQMVQTQPEIILSMIGELSVGPIRTMEQGTMHKDRVANLIQQRLGDVIHFPAITLVK